MMKADPLIISAVLKPWVNYGHIRYYCEWKQQVGRDAIDRYMEKTGIDPLDRKKGIKTFFDEEGLLHIDRCEDETMSEIIEKGISEWYLSACRRFERNFSKQIHIFDLIEPYLEEISKGRWLLRYEDIEIVLDSSDIAEIKSQYSVTYNELRREYSFSYPEKELEQIMSRIIRDKDPTGRGILPAER